MNAEKKSLIDILKESHESRFNILKKTLLVYWILSIIFLIVVTITLIIEKKNIISYAYGTPLGIIILMVLYHIFALYVAYLDCKSWNISKKWIIGVLLLGPIIFTIYYLKQKSLYSIPEETTLIEEKKEIEKTPGEITNETTVQPDVLADYKESIHTLSKKRLRTKSKQAIWRDIEKIEKEIDTLHIKKAKKPATEIDKKINHLLNKKKKK